MEKQTFIKTMRNHINNYCALHSIPEHIGALSLCQACLETGFGKSTIMMVNNAPYGIKATGNKPYYETTTGEYINGNYVTVKARFCAYNSLYEAVEDYFKLLSWSHYKPVMESKNFSEASNKIRECGYATSPTYTASLQKVYNEIYMTTVEDYNAIVATQKDPLNVREKPNTSSKILTTLPKGAKIKIETDWSYIPALGGFVSNKYIERS